MLYPLAGEKVEIDLDDGVKHNYPLFGKALKKYRVYRKASHGNKNYSRTSTFVRKNRVVFWYDDKRELRADFESLQIENVEKLKSTITSFLLNIGCYVNSLKLTSCCIKKISSQNRSRTGYTI